MQVTEISWVGVLTEDFGSAARFLTSGLGLSLEFRDEEKDIGHFRPPSGQLLEVYIL